MFPLVAMAQQSLCDQVIDASATVFCASAKAMASGKVDVA
jgi:hypothetical protein